MTLRPLVPRDWPAVADIYAAGLATGQASFETDTPAWEQWDRGHLAHSRLVAEEDGIVVGWAALSPVSGRRVYRGVAEVSVYVSSAAAGRGIGSALLRALIAEAEAAGVWTLQASIFPENCASVRLHRRCGFREVGRRERIGRQQGVWRDTILLERRSETDPADP